MAVTVRLAEPRDLDALVAGCLGCARDSEGLEPDPAVVRVATEAALHDPRKARFFVAESPDGVVGSLMVTYEWSDWYGSWNWWLQSVHVVPAWRGRGVYSALYDAVHAAARAEGNVRTVRLYVHADNEAGLRAYRGHGMEETHYRIFEAPVGTSGPAPHGP